MATLLVVGRTGQLAQAFARLCASSDLDTIYLGRPDLDLTKPETIERAMGEFEPKIILNASAYTNVDEAETDRDLAFEINARGPQRLAEFCARHDVPLVHISTDYVFNGKSTRPYRPDDLVGPLSSYGKSKAAGEAAVRRALEKHVIIRTAWVYSENGRNFLRTMLDLGKERTKLSIVDDQIGSPTYAADLAFGVDQIIRTLDDRSDFSHWGTFHMTNSGSASWFDFATVIFEYAIRQGYNAPDLLPIPTNDYPTPARRPLYSVLDCQSTEDTFGVRLRDWKDALSDCLDRYFSEAGVMVERS